MLDQDSESYELVPDYKNFKCDFLTHEKDYVMWQRFRWYRSHPGGAAVPVEPTLKDLDINRLQLEFYLSHEPTVQTLFNMDVHMFDIHSVSLQRLSKLCRVFPAVSTKFLQNEMMRCSSIP